MGKFIVGYDGFLTVDAKDESQAFEKATVYLNLANLVNDGDKGEWYVISTEQVDN